MSRKGRKRYLYKEFATHSMVAKQKEVRKRMSRMYVWVDSDTRQTLLTSRANQKLDITVNYGCKTNSKQLLRVSIQYPKDSEKPEIKVWRN